VAFDSGGFEMGSKSWQYGPVKAVKLNLKAAPIDVTALSHVEGRLKLWSEDAKRGPNLTLGSLPSHPTNGPSGMI